MSILPLQPAAAVGVDLLDHRRAPLYHGAMTASRNDPAREARLKAALKANIARRKSQARARAGAAGAEPEDNGQGEARQSGASTGRAAPTSERDTG